MRLEPHLLARVVTEALAEDMGPGDVTTNAIVPDSLEGSGEIRSRNAIVVAGIDAAVCVFRRLDPELAVMDRVDDGAALPAGARLLHVRAKARALLTGERVALNLLGRLSGIATLTRRYLDAAAPHAPEIADTRKTTPTLRHLEKYAVRAAGGTNHRSGLWDAVLIKDNHVDLAGGIRPAIDLVRAARGRAPIEIEVRNMSELDEALEAGAEMILLDNFPLGELEKVAGRARGRARLEVSGGVTLQTVPAIASLGVDRISVGALTHSAAAADLTMKVSPWKI